MNLFIIPSWYPSVSNPLYGIFIQEQIHLMARLRPDWTIGVSTWGQGDSSKLLWAKDHLGNLSKIMRHWRDNPKINKKTYDEYYQPALSWTKRIKRGNLKGILQSNERNFLIHLKSYGKPDCLWVQASYPGAFIGAYLSKKYHVPVVLHVRLGGFMLQQLIDDLGGMKSEWLNAIQQCDLITCTSYFHKCEIEKWIPDARVCYNPVDTDFFIPENLSEDYILAVGRLEEEKGFDQLIGVIQELGGVKIKIIGSGSHYHGLMQKIDRLGLQKSIELLGEKSRVEVKSLMQRCRFLVLPSSYETFGNVLLEAMACGKPVVATSCGGPVELVSTTCGILTEPNLSGLSKGIRQMVSSYQDYDPIKIRKQVVSGFSPKVWIDQLEDMIKGIVLK